jgi:hypothetical protein
VVAEVFVSALVRVADAAAGAAGAVVADVVLVEVVAAVAASFHLAHSGARAQVLLLPLHVRRRRW